MRKRGFGARVIRLGNESKAGALGRAAWTLGEESRDARWCPASALQAAVRCPLGPDLGSAAVGPSVSLPLQSSVDRDQNRVMLLGILRFQGSQNPRISPDEKSGSPGAASRKNLPSGRPGARLLRVGAGLAYCPEPLPGWEKVCAAIS